MKAVYLFTTLIVCLFTSSVRAAVDIYVKMTDYSNVVITKDASQASTIKDGKGGTIDLKDYVEISSLQYDLEQTLSIGSQSTGAGAGKITFNPLTFTKTVDAVSPLLLQYQASGKALKFVEIVFVKSSGGSVGSTVYHRIILKLAAVKSYAVSSVTDCDNGCVAESISFEYGGIQVYTYKQNADGTTVENPIFYGWNRVKNIEDKTNDPL